MKFNMMIGGVETFFPKTDVRFFKENNEVVVYFLDLPKEDLLNIEKNIKNTKLTIEDNFLVLNFKKIQYGHNIKNSPRLMELFLNGAGIGFAFEDESGNLLDIATPTFHNEI